MIEASGPALEHVRVEHGHPREAYLDAHVAAGPHAGQTVWCFADFFSGSDDEREALHVFAVLDPELDEHRRYPRQYDEHFIWDERHRIAAVDLDRCSSDLTWQQLAVGALLDFLQIRSPWSVAQLPRIAPEHMGGKREA